MSYKINCNNSECPENHRCHTFMAEPKENQVYERFQWRRSKDKSRDTTKICFGCDHFISMPEKLVDLGILNDDE